MKNYSFSLMLFFPDNISAKIALNSLLPELRFWQRKRSQSKINVKKNVFSIKITAEDTTALKASLNSLIKLIGLSFNLIKFKKGGILKWQKKKAFRTA